MKKILQPQLISSEAQLKQYFERLIKEGFQSGEFVITRSQTDTLKFVHINNHDEATTTKLINTRTEFQLATSNFLGFSDLIAQQHQTRINLLYVIADRFAIYPLERKELES